MFVFKNENIYNNTFCEVCMIRVNMNKKVDREMHYASKKHKKKLKARLKKQRFPHTHHRGFYPKPI